MSLNECDSGPDEVVGCDHRQSASPEYTMTLNEWNDLKRRSSMVRDFENIGPVKQCIDPAIGKDHSCYLTCRYSDFVFFASLIFGIIIGYVIGINV